MSQEAEPVNPVTTPQSDTNGDAPREATSDPKPEPTKEVDPDDPDGVLDRLTEVEPQKTKDESPSDDDESSEEKLASEDKPKEQEKKPSEDEDFDHTAELTEDEAKAVPERTRKRIERLLNERKEDRPLADYAAGLISTASKLGIKKQDLDAGINLMVGFLAGDKEADDRLVKVLTEQGVIKPPSAPAKANFDAVRASVNRMLKVDFSISEDVAASILKTIDEVEKEASSKPEEKPVQTQQEKPVKQPDTEKVVYQKAYQLGMDAVKSEMAEFQAKHTADFDKLNEKAFKKIGEWEAKMPPAIRDNPALFSSRYVKAFSEVLAERSKSSAVRPSANPLRSTQPPAPRHKLEKGTPEYEDAIMDGTISPDDE